jgi:glycogen operon protein
MIRVVKMFRQDALFLVTPGDNAHIHMPVRTGIAPTVRFYPGDRSLLARAVILLLCLWAANSGLAVGLNNLGATYDSNLSHLTFRVFSSRATRIDVYLYDQSSASPAKAHFQLTADPATLIFSNTLATPDLAAQGIAGTVYYNYRAWGPNWTFDPSWQPGSLAGFVTDVDDAGNRFNPNKVLLDPYALEVSHDPLTPQETNGGIYCSGPQFRTNDTGSDAPRGLALKPSDLGPAADPSGNPTRPFKDDIIYEVNLRGLTKNDPTIPTAKQGTYAGAAMKADYLKSLGVTAIEFLPLQDFQDDANDMAPSTAGNNYWGYDPQNYFAPDRRDSSDTSPGGPTREFKALVAAYHARGLKVYVDMVYNHTEEGGVDSSGNVGPILSWRGLDNATYYELSSDDHHYQDNNGVGANVNTANQVVRQEIMDALGYWKNNLGVDGYRFDLAVVLGNTLTNGGFNFDKMPASNVLNRAVNELPARPAAGGQGVDLIAEPWGVNDGNIYQLGGFPTGWAEWNGQFRDQIRTCQNQLGVAAVTTGALATRLAGSSDLFQPNGRKPWNSVNFLVCHDGFTLRDLYCYNSKQNQQPYPFGPSDGGTDDNISWDQSGDPAQQRQAARTGLAIVLSCAGVPMITGGDEMLRTQYGNNNAYNLDTDKNYLDYSNLTTDSNFFNFATKLMAFRTAHPALRPADFFTGAASAVNGLKDIAWLTDSGQEADANYLTSANNHFLAFRLNGQAAVAGEASASIYIAYNGWSGAVIATLPNNLPGKNWYRVADTAAWMEGRDNITAVGQEDLLAGNTYSLAGRSLLLLIEK